MILKQAQGRFVCFLSLFVLGGWFLVRVTVVDDIARGSLRAGEGH